jgi:hypothetical protein
MMDSTCFSVDEPVIPLSDKNLRLRLALKALMIGELGAAVGRAYVFGFMTGAMHLLSIWIDYMGYASMHYCQVSVISFCGGVEALMLFMNMRDGGPMQAKVYDSLVSEVVFWVMFAFAITKMYTAHVIKNKFKHDYIESTGGEMPFLPP